MRATLKAPPRNSVPTRVRQGTVSENEHIRKDVIEAKLYPTRAKNHSEANFLIY